MSSELVPAVKGPYTLITVTNVGEVRHTPGFMTLRMCQEARSIALTGMTLDEAHEFEMAELRRSREYNRQQEDLRRHAWNLAHPPRYPTETERALIRKLIFAWKPATKDQRVENIKHPWTGYFQAKLNGYAVGSDGLIYETFTVVGGLSLFWYQGNRNGLRGDHDIKYAKCVLELPDAP